MMNGAPNPQNHTETQSRENQVQIDVKKSKEKRVIMGGNIESQETGGTGMQWQSGLDSQESGC